MAKKFYQGTLGLKLEDETGTEAHTYRSGAARLIVYRSEFAGTNKATALNFIVGDEIDKLVKGLRDRGVTFEHYDGMPDVKRDGDIHIAGPDADRLVQGSRRQHPLLDEPLAGCDHRRRCLRYGTGCCSVPRRSPAR